jgi:hypothetical protein
MGSDGFQRPAENRAARLSPLSLVQPTAADRAWAERELAAAEHKAAEHKAAEPMPFPAMLGSTVCLAALGYALLKPADSAEANVMSRDAEAAILADARDQRRFEAACARECAGGVE